MTEITLQAGAGLGAAIRTLNMADIRVTSPTQDEKTATSIRCPHCSTVGVFAGGSGGTFSETVPVVGGGGNYGVAIWLGMRQCPNVECGGPVFLICQGSKCLASFPPEVIDFDAANVPGAVAHSPSEAILCHASGCYRAAAIMVRRTLEELCHERGAEGGNLQKRLAALKSLITLPNALFEAMNELRLLGNDAAHIAFQPPSLASLPDLKLCSSIRQTRELTRSSRRGSRRSASLTTSLPRPVPVAYTSTGLSS